MAVRTTFVNCDYESIVAHGNQWALVGLKRHLKRKEKAVVSMKGSMSLDNDTVDRTIPKLN